MANEFLERGARALAKIQSGVDDWDALDEAFQANLIDQVRQIYLANPDPTDAMVAAFDRFREQNTSIGYGEESDHFYGDAAGAWTAMIQAGVETDSN